MPRWPRSPTNAGAPPACGWPTASRSRPTWWSPTPIWPGPTATCCRRSSASTGPTDKLDRAQYSNGLFVWYFGTKRYADVKHHSILLGPRYKGLLNDIFKRKHLADDFSLYLHRPTATDPSLAPEGCDTFYALSPVPHLDGDVDWAERAETYRQAISDYLSKTVLPDLENQAPDLAGDDANRFRAAPAVVQGRRIQPGARADAERLDASPQSERRG
jgi:hypothetical protein